MTEGGWPGRIVVVGGGTAGWLAAMMLSQVAGRKAPGTAVTVIESSRIGVIGVGEGSTAVFRQMLRRFGLNEEEFLRETGATIELGIRHRDWRRLGHHYDGPIDNPALVAPGVPLDAYAVAAGRPVQEAHLFQHLIDLQRSPYAEREGRRVSAGPFHHAFHFDQARVGQWLRRKARGIRLVDDQVTEVERGGDGIAALHPEPGTRVEGDLFVDASGFRRRLIGEVGAQGPVGRGLRALPPGPRARPGADLRARPGRPRAPRPGPRAAPEMARDPALRRRAQEACAGLVKEYARAARQCLPHRAWLQSLQQDIAA